jgi:hypothetical protein
MSQSSAGSSFCGGTGADEMCEGSLPPPVREALGMARAARPNQRLRCLTFHSEENGRELLRLGARCAALRPREVMVLSVAVSETAAEEVRTVTHTLVIKIEEER